ncbi:MAG: hypothetical protein RSE32_08165 [Comamonas sp.]|uniref:hypothetical protein n=1 Tax=Comamonas sp. TaxID=34028 RepID=UPI002FC95D2F
MKYVGDDNVLVGKFPENAVIGNGNVIWRATDAAGNVMLNQAMAMGRGARSYGDSIAIGANALGGLKPVALEELLRELNGLIQQASGLGTIEADRLTRGAMDLRVAMQQPSPDLGALATAWKGLEVFATSCGIVDGIDKLGQFFRSIPGG